VMHFPDLVTPDHEGLDRIKRKISSFPGLSPDSLLTKSNLRFPCAGLMDGLQTGRRHHIN
jgi:hypothetical protein